MIESIYQLFVDPDSRYCYRRESESVTTAEALRSVYNLLSAWAVTVTEVTEGKLIVEQKFQHNGFLFRWTFNGDPEEMSAVFAMFGYFAKFAKTTHERWVQNEAMLNTRHTALKDINELVVADVPVRAWPLLSYALALGADDFADLLASSRCVNVDGGFLEIIRLSDVVDVWKSEKEAAGEVSSLTEWLTV